MKVRSACRPWAWGIVHGGKRVEKLRSRTSYNGPLIIHFGRSRRDLEEARRVGDRPEVILTTYAHWSPGAGKPIATQPEEMYG